MFEKLYGSVEDRENLVSILDNVRSDLKRVQGKLSPDDRQLLEEHAQFVSQMEKDMKQAREQKLDIAPPDLAKGVSNMNASTGLFANMGTAFLVLAATPLGYPVSTTHVATGSLIWVRVAGNARAKGHDALRVILLAWLVTLPIAGATVALVAHFLVA